MKNFSDFMSWIKSGLSSSKFWKDLFIMTFGILIGGISLYYFLLPTGVVIGTVTGLAMVLNALIPIIKVSHFVLILNVFLVILAITVVGKEFGLKSIFTSILLGPAMDFCEWIYPIENLLAPGQTTVMGDIWFDLCCFVILLSASQAILFRINASSGGLDIIAMILNKIWHIDIGTCVTFAGVVVCFSAMFIPDSSFRMIIIGIIGTWLNGLAIDYFMTSLNRRKRVCIVSPEYESIRKYIIDDLSRGCTLYDIRGGYSETPGVELQALLTQHEYGCLLEYIENNHINAFMTAGNCSEVHGLWNQQHHHKKNQ